MVPRVFQLEREKVENGSIFRRHIWMFPKIVVPQIIHFNRVFHYEPTTLEYPYFFGNTHISTLKDWEVSRIVVLRSFWLLGKWRSLFFSWCMCSIVYRDWRSDVLYIIEIEIYIYIYIYICILSIHPSICSSIYLSIYLSFSTSLYINSSIYNPIHLYIWAKAAPPQLWPHLG